MFRTCFNVKITLILTLRFLLLALALGLWLGAHLGDIKIKLFVLSPLDLLNVKVCVSLKVLLFK